MIKTSVKQLVIIQFSSDVGGGGHCVVSLVVVGIA